MKVVNKMGGLHDRVRESVQQWVDRREDEWTLDELWGLLVGIGLPAVGDEEPTAAWILLGIQTAESEERFVGRLAKLIDSGPEKRQDPLRGEALYNLFYLCNELSDPEVLGKPLWKLYERWKHSKPRVDYAGGDVLDRLRAALASNQHPEDRHELAAIWQPMLKEGYDGYLPGGVDQGFHGIVMLGTGPGEWPKDEIGRALATVAHRIAPDEKTRCQDFSRYLRHIPSVLGTIPNWHWELIYLGHTHSWPEWTRAALPAAAVVSDGWAIVPDRVVQVWNGKRQDDGKYLWRNDARGVLAPEKYLFREVKATPEVKAAVHHLGEVMAKRVEDMKRLQKRGLDERAWRGALSLCTARPSVLSTPP